MKCLIVFLILVLSVSAEAQKTPLFSMEGSEAKTLRLSEMSSEVSITRGFADTTLELAYHNSSYAAIQGLFKIHLPDGAVVRDFALRLGDKWQPGSLIEKHKARQTFEEIVRRGMDPAVLAWNDGAEYQVRIFPFPAQGKRWIRIRYWQDLKERASALQYQLPLPMGLKLDAFRLKLNAEAGALGAVKVNDEFTNHVYLKAMSDKKNTFGAMVDERGFTIPGNLGITVAAATKSENDVWVGKASPKGDMAYIGARWAQLLPLESRALAKNVLLFIDSSRSVSGVDPVGISSFVSQFRARLPKSSALIAYEFNASVRKLEISQIEKLNFDGGTNFAAVFEEIERQEKKLGDVEALILSDAVSTMEKETALSQLKVGKSKLFFLPVSDRFNPHFATDLAEKTSGAVLPRLQKNAENFATVFEAFNSATWRFTGFKAEGGAVSDVLPEVGSPLRPGDGPEVYFRAKTKGIPASGVVTVSNGKTTLDFNVRFTDAQLSTAVENLWAMKKLFSLIPQADEYEKDLIAHATRYSLVSPKTSYIVLENDFDYQQFNITKAKAESTNEDGDQPASFVAMSDKLQVIGGGAGGGGFGRAAMKDGPTASFQAREAVSAPSVSLAKRVPVRPGGGFVGKPFPSGASVSSLTINGNRLESTVSVQDDGYRYSQRKASLSKIKEIYQNLNSPEMTDAWFFVEMAKQFAERGERERALRVLSNLFEISREDGQALRTLGLVGCFEGNCEWAIKAFELAIELRPEEPQNIRDLAWFYAECGQNESALKTMAKLRGQNFHNRFPGMEQLVAREIGFMEQLMGMRKPQVETMPAQYSWITWNNDNSDVDFHIKERSGNTVSYQNRSGQGQLSNDFTRGYGPEIYSAKEHSIAAQYFAHYYRQDVSSVSSNLVVKFAVIENRGDGKIKIQSQLFPLSSHGQMVRLN